MNKGDDECSKLILLIVGILAVYSAFLGRVPGPVGAILINSSILFTMVFSKILLRKVYNRKQLGGAALVFLGIAISMIPTFIQINQHGAGQATAWYVNIQRVTTKASESKKSKKIERRKE